MISIRFARSSLNKIVKFDGCKTKDLRFCRLKSELPYHGKVVVFLPFGSPARAEKCQHSI